MDCEVIAKNLEAYVDGELTLSDRRDLEEHLDDCDACTSRLDNMRALQKLIRSADHRNAPATLKRNIQKQMKDYTGEDNKSTGWLGWIGIAGGSLALGSLTTWIIMTFMLATSLPLQLVDEIISSHVQSLMVDHVTDVMSTDKHTIKPWFNGRIDYSPNIRNLESNGFELVGGRLDYIQGKAVSALVYKRREHIINFFVLNNTTDRSQLALNTIQRQGYNLIHWSSGRLDYWVISDLNEKELTEFTRLMSDS